MRNQKGMTFVELGVAVLLIFVLAMGWVMIFGSKSAEARDASRIEKARKIEKVLLDAFITNGTYPDKSEFEDLLVEFELTDQKAGKKECIGPDEALRDCDYIYETGNKGFDFILVVSFETEAFVSDLYETFSWRNDDYYGLIKSTEKLDL